MPQALKHSIAFAFLVAFVALLTSCSIDPEVKNYSSKYVITSTGSCTYYQYEYSCKNPDGCEVHVSRSDPWHEIPFGVSRGEPYVECSGTGEIFVGVK